VTANNTRTDGTDASPAAPAIPTVMPCRYALAGSAGSVAANAGFAVGLFAALSGGLRRTLITARGFIPAAGVVLAIPVLPMLLALCMTLSALAAVEVARSGTRVSVMVLMGVILFAVATERWGDARFLALAALGL